jgi:hypothetical protein
VRAGSGLTEPARTALKEAKAQNKGSRFGHCALSRQITTTSRLASPLSRGIVLAAIGSSKLLRLL